MSTIDKASLIQIPSGYKNGKLYSVKPTPSYGSEEITNGDFSSNSDWTLTSSANITNGKLNVSAGAFDFFAIQTALVNGNFYKISIEVAVTSGSVLLYTGSQFATITSSGVYNYNFTSDSTQIRFRSSGSGFVGSIDNVSVKEITNIGDFDFSRSSSGTRVNSEGLIETAQVLGSEKVTNGDFATDSDWTINDWSISGGSLNGSASTGIVFQNPSGVIVGKTYKVILEVKSYTSGSIRIKFGGSSYSNVASQVGVQEFYIQAVTNGGFLISVISAFTGSIDNVSVKEVFENDVPRLDYSGGASCASLLLEPQSTNTLIYSEDFSQWSNVSTVTLTSGQLAPDGTLGATKISGTLGLSSIYLPSSTSTTATRSIYAKTVSGTGTARLTSYYGNTNNLFTLTEEWQRFELTGSDSTGGTNFYIDFRDSAQTLNEFIIWGAQSEELSYPTSYIISNSGSSTTRTADVCNNAGTSATFNSEEGVLFAEIAALADDETDRRITISDGTTNNRMAIGFDNASNKIKYFLISSNTIQVNEDVSVDNITQYNKIAFLYKENDFKLYMNGSLIASDTSGSTFSENTLNVLNFAGYSGTSQNFYGKTKQLMVFDEALSDEELSDLTGQVNLSFNNLATFYGYTIL